MSVLSTWTATPNRIFHICRIVEAARQNKISEDDLLDQISPPSIRDENSASQKGVLREMINLGIMEVENDAYQLTNQNFAKDSSTLRKHIEYCLLNIDEAEKCNQSPFTMALGWFLRRNPQQGIPSKEP